MLNNKFLCPLIYGFVVYSVCLAVCCSSILLSLCYILLVVCHNCLCWYISDAATWLHFLCLSFFFRFFFGGGGGGLWHTYPNSKFTNCQNPNPRGKTGLTAIDFVLTIPYFALNLVLTKLYSLRTFHSNILNQDGRFALFISITAYLN